MSWTNIWRGHDEGVTDSRHVFFVSDFVQTGVDLFHLFHNVRYCTGWCKFRLLGLSEDRFDCSAAIGATDCDSDCWLTGTDCWAISNRSSDSIVIYPRKAQVRSWPQALCDFFCCVNLNQYTPNLNPSQNQALSDGRKQTAARTASPHSSPVAWLSLSV
jgi:hypothetical protein